MQWLREVKGWKQKYILKLSMVSRLFTPSELPWHLCYDIIAINFWDIMHSKCFPSRWTMLKQWLVNDGKTDSITVEEKFLQWVEQLRTDRYVTAPWPFFNMTQPSPVHVGQVLVYHWLRWPCFSWRKSTGSPKRPRPLSRIYARDSWKKLFKDEDLSINDCSPWFFSHHRPELSCCVLYLDHWSWGQAGTPHPQAPNNPKAKMYKVLREVVEETSSGTRGETSLSVGGRVRSPAVKALLAKQLQTGLASLESQGQVDLKTGKITSKKPKKEKTAEQVALGEVKTLHSKFLVLDHINRWICSNVVCIQKNIWQYLQHLRWKKAAAAIPLCISELDKYNVRNSDELVTHLYKMLACLFHDVILVLLDASNTICLLT